MEYYRIWTQLNLNKNGFLALFLFLYLILLFGLFLEEFFSMPMHYIYRDTVFA